MGLTRLRASQISDIDYKQAVRAVSTSNITLSGGAPATVDGVALSLNNRILVTGQTTGSQNGIYYVTTVGSGSDGTWTRSLDTNATGELLAGTIVMVTEGTTYADTQWKLTTNDPIVIGTTPLTFVINILSQIGGGNTQIQYNNAGTMGASANLTWNGTTLYTNGAVSATGNVTGNYILGNGSQLSGIVTTVNANTLTGNTLSSNVTNSSLTSVGTLSSLSVTGNVNSGNLRTAGLVSATGAITGAAITGTSLTVSTGNVTLGNIVNAGANGVGNIGSASTYFNTVFAKSTSAQYADLAEKYTADAEYAPGTVVAFGGNAEVTLANEAGSTRIAGVISTNPSYTMNATLDAQHVAVVALQGRVPCRVIGPVRKGDMMIAAGNGVACVDNAARAGTIIGKALENFDGVEGTIEVVVGRF